MAEPILDISTLTERRSIRIDGTLYEILNPSEFSIVDFHQVAKKADRVKAVFSADRELTEDEVKELDTLLSWLCSKVVIVPDEIRARFNINHKLAILGAFTDLQREEAQALPAGGPAPAPTTPSTGESGSPA